VPAVTSVITFFCAEFGMKRKKRIAMAPLAFLIE
jgi:hypothetical protein